MSHSTNRSKGEWHRALAWIIMACLLTLTGAAASKPQVYMTADTRIAINGYDPVMYFIEGKPQKGKNAWQHSHNGATWQFANRKHLELFKENPDKFTPQFGGYCAFSVAQGLTLPSKPQFWQIHEDKLYLNRNANIHNRWLERYEVLSDRADDNWPAVLNGEFVSPLRQQLIDAENKRRANQSQ